MNLPPITMTPSLCSETLDMMIGKLDEVIEQYSSRTNPMENVLRDMALQRAAMEYAKDMMQDATVQEYVKMNKDQCRGN